MRSLRYVWWRNKDKARAVVIHLITVPVLVILTPFALLWVAAYRLHKQANKGGE